MSQTERTEDRPARRRRERPEVPPERQEAARRQIRTLGDPVLREVARPVEKFDDELAALSRRMIAIMRDAPGVGLAATQLGVVQRVLVYEVDDEPVTLVNPKIVSASRDTEVADEGCLSLPGMTLPVERPLPCACAPATCAAGASSTTSRASRRASSSTRPTTSTASSSSNAPLARSAPAPCASCASARSPSSGGADL